MTMGLRIYLCNSRLQVVLHCQQVPPYRAPFTIPTRILASFNSNNPTTTSIQANRISPYSSHHVRSYASAGSNLEPGRVKRAWRWIAKLVKGFMDGTKALYYDMRRISELQRKRGRLVIQASGTELEEGKPFPFTREEVQFMYQTKRDLMKMLPTIIVFFIPLLGYAVPVVVFMYPQLLLSKHFWTEEQRQQFSKTAHSSRVEYFKSLAKEIKKQVSPDKLEFLSNLREKMMKFQGGCADWSDIRSTVEKNPSLPFSWKQLPWRHMSSLSRGWGLAWWLPPALQRRRLERHLCYIFITDQLFRSEGGVESLSHEELAQGCLERGLDVDSELLNNWISLSTQFRDCPVALLAHAPIAQFL